MYFQWLGDTNAESWRVIIYYHPTPELQVFFQPFAKPRSMGTSYSVPVKYKVKK